MENKPFIKPSCKLIGTDGNVFALMGKASQAKKAGYPEKAKEMLTKIMSGHSYDESLQAIMEYVEVE